MTPPADKETPTKALEITNPVTELSRSTVKRKKFSCVLTSPDYVYKKTANPKLMKSAAKKRKLAGVSAAAFLQQNTSNPIEDDNNVHTECWENYS